MGELPPTGTDTNQANPYIAGSPVTVSEMFFGRDDVFDFVRQAMVGRHRDNVIVLYGQRRTGKTSILYQLQRQLGARYVCVFIDLHALALDSLGGALWELAASITRVLRREHDIVVPRQERAAFLDDPRAQFENEFLGQVVAAIGDRQLLLMLDEVVRLQEQIEAGKLDKDIFSYLRHLMQHHSRLTFLFSLGSGLEEMSKDYALLFSVALYKKISFLDREAASALVQRPVDGLFQFDADALERILEVTCGHPYFTQLVCHSLFNRWQRRHTPRVGRDDVDAVIDEAAERGLAVLKHVWEESTSAEKVILAGLAAAGQGSNQPVRLNEVAAIWSQRGLVMPEREVSGAIQSLISRDVISGRDAYTFTVDLQRRWVVQYRRVEWVHEEIGDRLARWSAPLPETPAPAGPVDGPATGEAPMGPVERSGTWARPVERSGTWVNVTLAGLGIVLAVALVVWALTRPSPGTPPAVATSAAPAPTATLAAALPTTTSNPPVAAPTSAAAPATPAAVGAPVISVPAGLAANVNDLAVAGGVVWAATEGGLVRWTSDGIGQVLTGSQFSFGFDDPDRQAIAVATDGSLWIGAGGIAHVRLDGARMFGLGYYNRDDGLGMGIVGVVLVDTDGSVWAGGQPTTGKPPPLSHFDGKSHADGNAWHALDIPLDRAPVTGLHLDIRSILRSRDGGLWLGLAEGGILRWDGAGWTHFPAAASVNSTGKCPTRLHVRRLIEDRGGTIWAAGTCQGLLRRDSGTDSWQQVAVGGSPHTVTALMLSTTGQLWVAGPDLVASTADGGQSWAVLGTAADGLGTDTTALVEGSDGRTWLADYDVGVSVLDGQQWRHLQR